MNDTRTAEAGALVLRLALGVMYLAHAHLKVFTYGLDASAQFFASVGYPGWMAAPVILAEVAAGVLLVLGVYARRVALAMLPVLFGALAVHLPNGWVFSAPNGGWEYPAFLAVASVVLALIGEGLYALRPGAAPQPRLA